MIEDAAEAGAEAVTAAFGDHLKIVCTPLRSYEGFAEHVLGVEKTLTAPSPHRFGSDGHLFWLHFSLEYRGMMKKQIFGISFDLKLYRAYPNKQPSQNEVCFSAAVHAIESVVYGFWSASQ